MVLICAGAVSSRDLFRLIALDAVPTIPQFKIQSSIISLLSSGRCFLYHLDSPGRIVHDLTDNGRMLHPLALQMFHQSLRRRRGHGDA